MLRLAHLLRSHSWWIAYLWIAVAVILAAQLTVGFTAATRETRLAALLLTNVAAWLDFVVVTPLILWLAAERPLTAGERRRNLPVHLLAALVIAFCHVVWYAVLEWSLNPFGTQPPPSFPRVFFLAVLIQFHTGVIIYAIIVAIRTVIDSAQRLAQREADAAKLAGELAQAQLEALRRQLEPHFLFNTLNGIAGLVREGRGDAAVDMIAGLSDMLRRVTRDSGRQLVPLAEELAFLESYIGVQSMRMGDRLQVSVEIPLELSTALVPPLLLQPIVENAILHGVSKLLNGGRIRVTAYQASGVLSLHLYNDGPAEAVEHSPQHVGVGLSNTRRRLQTACGAASSVELRPFEDTGMETIITLPYRTAA